MKKNTILIVGNSTDSEDSLAIKIADRIKDRFPHFTFLSWDPTEELPEGMGQNIILIDTVQGIDAVKIFQGVDDFLLSPRNTVHDFDLPITLKMLHKIGRVKTVTIVGIPQKGNMKTIINDVSSFFLSISP